MPRAYPLALLLIAPFLLLFMPLAAVIGWLSYSNTEQAVEQFELRLATEMGTHLQERVDQLLRVPPRVAALQAERLRTGVDGVNQEALMRALVVQLRHEPSLTFVSIGLADGQYIGATRPPGAPAEQITLITALSAEGGTFDSYAVTPDLRRGERLVHGEPFDARQRGWFQQAVQSGTHSWYPVYRYRAYNSLGVGVSTPVYDGQGALLGVVTADVALAQLGRHLHHQFASDGALAFVTETNGELVALSNDDPLFRVRGEQSQRITLEETDNPLLRAAAAHLSSCRSEVGVHFIDLGPPQGRYLLTIHPCQLVDGPALQVGLLLPEQPLLASLSYVRDGVIWLTLAAIALTLLTAGLVTTRVARPVQALSRVANRLASGEWITLPKSRAPIAEIDDLAWAFATMQQRLRSHVETLEARIADRTRALSESNAALQSAFDSTAVGMALISREGRFLRVNEAFCQLLQRSAAQLIRLTVAEVSHPDDLGTEQLEVARVVSGEQSRFHIEKRYLRPDGEVVWGLVSAAQACGEDGQPLYFVAQVVDITERKRSEERLRLIATVFEYSHDGIVITDRRQRILDVNRSFEEVTGYRREEVIGRTPALLRSGHHPPAFYSQMWEALSELGFWSGELWNRRKSGEIYVEHITISAVRYGNGEVDHYVGIFSDITHVKEQQRRLERMAHYDPLTQLPNRILLNDRLQLALAQASRSGTVLAVCYLDLDGFKPVNDLLGHAAGDRLLVEVADRLRHCLRAGDTAARLGGDEFALVLTGISGVQDCEHTLNRLLAQLGQPFVLGGKTVAISASIGAALYPNDGYDTDALLRHADRAMYQAKQDGRNRYQLYDADQNRQAYGHRQALTRLQQALQQDELVLYYQPRVDLRWGRMVGVEALVRWCHPERGLLAPADFLPLAEGTDLIDAIGDWVLQRAIEQATVWHQAGLPLTVSVNIAGHHLRQAEFVPRLAELMAAHPELPRQALECEIREAVALEEIADTSRIIDAAEAIGVSFALDDFGTGFSSLSFFKRLPARTLKLHESFVQAMLDESEALAVTEGVIALAKAFDRVVTAEGVATIEHGALLVQLGCDLAQGYAIANPMPAAQIAPWAAQWKPPAVWALSSGVRWSEQALPVLKTELEHRRWVDQLLAHLHAPEMEPPPVLDLQQCHFGRWLQLAQDGSNPELAEEQAILAPLHQELHRIADELVLAKQDGHLADDDPRLARLLELRDQLLSGLQLVRALS